MFSLIGPPITTKKDSQLPAKYSHIDISYFHSQRVIARAASYSPGRVINSPHQKVIHNDQAVVHRRREKVKKTKQFEKNA
jgi:hypothetical protein